jgi:L-ascorbate metabolism protein UlaG (beta-lactamase superfamily)
MDAREAAGLAKAISPEIAVPMHYGGHVEGCGSVSDAEVFRREAAPVQVEILDPVHPLGEG